MNKLIIDGAEHTDQWRHLADDEALPQTNFTVDISRWETQRDAILSHIEQSKAALGLRIGASFDPLTLMDDVGRFELIVIHIEDPVDGRFFSIATRLREHLHYRHEIRVSGRVAPDQLVFMQRSGINGFDLDEEVDIERFLTRYRRFYQAGTHATHDDELIRQARRKPIPPKRGSDSAKPRYVLIDGVIEQDNF